MRQALAVSKDWKNPETYMPWQRETRTRSFADFKKAYPFMFPSKAKKT